MDTTQQAALVSRTSDEVTQVYKTNYVLTSCNKSNPICFTWVWLIIMHHHIKSGHKGSSGKLCVHNPNNKNTTISDTDTDKDTCVKRNHACHIIQGSGGCGFFPVWEGRSFIDHSTCTFFCVFFKWRPTCVLQFHSFRPRISPQWLSKLRWLWPSIPRWAVCELVSLMGSNTMPGQQGQPTLALLGHGCYRQGILV